MRNVYPTTLSLITRLWKLFLFLLLTNILYRMAISKIRNIYIYTYLQISVVTWVL